MVTNRAMDWRPRFDPRSAAYSMQTMAASKPLRSYTWECRPHLDQGTEGACVGFAWAHELAARPKVVRRVDDTTARSIYAKAQVIDEWAGEDYEGTSVLAGAKVLKDQGYVLEYRWGFSLDDVLKTVGYYGPVVMGTWWYEGMWEPDGLGFVYADGEQVGGHAWLLRGVNVRGRYVIARNSWGPQWGPLGGDFRLFWDDLAKLLLDQGEACIPSIRSKKGTRWWE